jgi:glycosyltransferase involved in cell wall biosynthesis
MELPPVSDGKRSAASGPAPTTAMLAGSSGADLVGEKTVGPRVAVLVPCHNEEAAVAKVVADFRAALPTATVYVYDNASTDRTSELARAAGAVVRREPRKGKGNVVRRMFADVEADIYVLVDGDATYHAASAPAMVDKLQSDLLDMVNGARITQEAAVFRAGHRLGNRILAGIVAMVFGNHIQDMLSGFRVLSRRFVKSFPALSRGFEIETELTVHALELRMPVDEVATPYGSRPEGSNSKLSTIKDGIRILLTIVTLLKEERPLLFFGAIAAFCALLSLVLAYPLLVTYFETHLVPRFPTAILSAAIMLLAFLSLSAGFILDTVTRGRLEMKRMQYLSLPAPR